MYRGVLFRAFLEGKFDSVETMQLYVTGFGLLAPLILVLIQAMQVVFPVLPGFFGCIVGSALFGWKGGFLCNYIGISTGSVMAFLLARKYGQQLLDYFCYLSGLTAMSTRGNNGCTDPSGFICNSG